MRFLVLFCLPVFLGCAQQPTRERVAVWSYFLEQCKNEGIKDLEAMQGCITLKLQQTRIGSNTGDVLQAMGYALRQGTPPQVVDCHTTTLIGGYRTVCQ